MARVLVTDGEQRSALAVVRSLGAAGHEVHLADRNARPLAGASRFVRELHPVPSPLEEPRRFAGELAAAASRISADVVLPLSDASALAVLEARDRFSGARVPLPSLEAFREASRKDHLWERAREHGFSVPEQCVVPDPPAAERIAHNGVPYPASLKSTVSVVEDGDHRRSTGVAHAATPRDLVVRLRDLPAEAYPVMVQRRVVGPGIGIFLLVWDGELLAHFGHRRIREKPPAGGRSVVRESVPVDPEVLERTVALFRSLEWRGVAMLECKVDEETGEPYVLEANGRFWGSLQLAVDAGVDFPRLLVDASLGRTPSPVTDYRTGMRSRWFWGDTDHLLLSLLRSPERLSLPPGHPGRLATLRRYLADFRPGVRFEVLRWRDPRPFLRETVAWCRGTRER